MQIIIISSAIHNVFREFDDVMLWQFPSPESFRLSTRHLRGCGFLQTQCVSFVYLANVVKVHNEWSSFSTPMVKCEYFVYFLLGYTNAVYPKSSEAFQVGHPKNGQHLPTVNVPLPPIIYGSTNLTLAVRHRGLARV